MSGHVLVGGGTGFIGRHLVKQLAQNGYQVTVASRTGGGGKISWDDIKQNGIPDSVSAIVNLAGEQILSLRARTSPEQFQKDVRSSRLGTAQICAQVCNERFSSGNPIETFIQGSAVGYYHVGEKYSNEVYTEESGGGTEGEMAILVKEWEAAAKLSDENSTRLILLRTGVVMGNGGGIIQNTIPSFKLGLGGPISLKGDQILNWIHMDDEVGIIKFLLETSEAQGIVNAVAPEIQTNKQWAQAFASALGRPCVMFVPTCAMDLAYGSEIAKLVNEGSAVEPAKLNSLGYTFKHPKMSGAMENIAQNSSSLLSEISALLK